jgi:hypothetical protein
VRTLVVGNCFDNPLGPRRLGPRLRPLRAVGRCPGRHLRRHQTRAAARARAVPPPLSVSGGRGPAVAATVLGARSVTLPAVRPHHGASPPQQLRAAAARTARRLSLCAQAGRAGTACAATAMGGGREVGISRYPASRLSQSTTLRGDNSSSFLVPHAARSQQA